MTEPLTLTAALIAGMVTSVHCVGMCGPIACTVGAAGGQGGQRLSSITMYHLGRLVAYATVGGLCGYLGMQVLSFFFDSPAVLLPWFLLFVFLLIATGLYRNLPRPAFFTKFFARVRLRTMRLSPTKGALLMGLATPLLPCGPLYLLFGASLSSGSAVRGAEFALAFGLGTLPLLWAAQQSFAHLKRRLNPLTLQRIQRVLAILAVLVIAWRLQDTVPLLSPAAASDATAAEPNTLPSCGCE